MDTCYGQESLHAGDMVNGVTIATRAYALVGSGGAPEKGGVAPGVRVKVNWGVA